MSGADEGFSNKIFPRWLYRPPRDGLGCFLPFPLEMIHRPIGVKMDEPIDFRLAIKCFNPHNELIGQLLVPELVSNLEFGGKEGNILYVTATSSLYSMELNQIGAKYK